MTDKEVIMVDDVDVSGCLHLGEWKHCNICKELIKTHNDRNGKPREHLLTEEDLRCEYYSNCHYKQKVRTEQQLEAKNKEIEKLKGKLKVATEALNFITGTCPDNECKKHKYIITRLYQDCYHCLVEKAQQALKQIESEQENG